MQITKELIEELLWEAEGATLDFKRDQYPFASATDAEKSELLKDILAFANAFRREDAFILIGVKENKGGQGEVVGIAQQLEDAHLQQFIKGKVQRPITFAYKAMDYNGLPIGVIHIPKQKRPFHSVVDFGKVQKDAVYIRRGSSTGIASPDEIAAMGADQIAAHAAEPTLEFSLFDRETGANIGTSITINTTFLDLPPTDDIPDYYEAPNSPFEINLGSVNEDFYREFAEAAFVMHLVRKISFSITNSGDVTAHDVRAVFEVADQDEKFRFLTESELPTTPRKRSERFHIPAIKNSMLARDCFNVEKVGSKWRIECTFGKIQPKDTVRLGDDLYVGSIEGLTLDIDVNLFADNLSKPVTAPCQIVFEIEKRVVALNDLKKL